MLGAPSTRKSQARYGKGTGQEILFCKDRIEVHKLPMKLAGVEYLFEGEKIIFYFLADGRVDFRELVRDLAQLFGKPGVGPDLATWKES